MLEAKGGQEAIKTAKEHIGPIRLLLTDIVMWKENGRQVTDAIIPSRPTMKVLYMSAFVGHASDLLEKNASFITKPFTVGAFRCRSIDTRHLTRRARMVVSHD